VVNKAKNSTIDEDEVAKFSAIADEWWDETGKFKPLHLFNPVRIKFLRNTIEKHFNQSHLKGLSVLDVGCGGGLISEPIAKMGANVTGIDASDRNIKIASIHAEKENLEINYQFKTAEELVTEKKKFDVVLAMEILEHVADVPVFIESCCKLVKPGGLLFFATMNRTVKSYAFAIVGAEYVLRWLPQGTHDWNKFLRPSEIVIEAEKNKTKATKVQGVTYNPLGSTWSLSEDTDVNYMVVLEKQ
jgi:2-polyprenyl-6-hydroxyphenyl methylase/3-demethylubiquinone-9 3-methyltransferase